jgi:hypothetical protein
LAIPQDYLSKEHYLCPEEKYTLIRVIPYLLWLIDGDYQVT